MRSLRLSKFVACLNIYGQDGNSFFVNLVRLKAPLVATFLLASLTTLGQGSRILAPNYGGTASIGVPGAANDDFAWLEHDAFASTNFLDPAATADERMFVYLRAGETLRFGIRRIPVLYEAGVAYLSATANPEPDNQDLIIIIHANDGTIVQATHFDADAGSTQDATLITSNGSGTEGIITSVASSLLGPEFTIGPTTYNSGGYEPREYTNTTGSDQAFYISFLQEEYTFVDESTLITDINSVTISDQDIRSWYDLWDFTVYDQEVEQTGRLYCKRWGFTAQFLENLYADEMEFFARIPSTVNGFDGNYVKKVDIGGIDPFSSTLFANSTGADLGSVADINGDGSIDFLDARKSNTDETIGALEYDIFLQNPDVSIWPTSTLPTVTIADAVITCNSSGRGQASIYFETNQIGEISILVDLNGTAGHQDGTEDVIIERQITSVGASTVIWNGLDGLGNEVAAGTTITISGRFTAGPLHVPMGDVESSPTGINMEDVRPTTSFNLIYWDDASPGAITNASPTTNLSGSNTNRHIWTGGSGDGDLINTWSFGYYQINTQVIAFDYDCDSDGDGVRNDLDEDVDNDGISNAIEGDPDLDTDADGIPDYIDTDVAGFVDSNGDGINDNFDADQDGIINAYDLDSDNDGIPDTVEFGLTDADNDGQVEAFTDANANGLDDNSEADPHTRVDASDDACAFLDGGDHFLVFNTSTVDETAPALGDVQLTFGITGDLDNGTDESFTLTLTGEATTSIIDDGDLNGTYTATDSNEGTYVQCNDIPMTFTVTIPRADWNVFNDDGIVNITVDVNGTVGNFCTNNTSSCISDVRVSYLLDNTGGSTLTAIDTDNDGISDFLDLDSDNDGIVDAIEAGGTANTSNGQIANFTDTNGNGWNDNEEIFALSLTDTDSDGTLPDYRDIDSDNDGIVDSQEGQSSQSYIAPGSFIDADNDGLNDIYDPNNGGTFITPVNSDGTGDADYISADSDGDGVEDLIEGFDANQDGFGDWDAVGANNSITDEVGFNVDADSDGLWDIFDTEGGGAAAGIGNVTATNASIQNTDNADNADWQDTDDDNDGILTSGEDDNSNGNFADDRTQGQVGGSSPPDYLFKSDCDGDGIADSVDLDSDNDGVLDSDEDGGTGFDPSGDEDADGIPNYRDSNDATIIGSIGAFVDVNSDGVDDRFDKDQDTVPDFLDIDADNDGLYDAYEANNGVTPAGFDDATGQFTLDDPDNDGLMNQVDNNTISAGGSSNLPNPDFDSDGINDFADLDSDNDGIPDNVEFQVEGSMISPSGVDSDGDGLDDAFDPNNGGVQITPVNTDAGGEPDYRDEDSDDDSILDRVEGSDADNNGFGDWDDNNNGLTDEVDYSTDTDGDGIVDAFDNVATINDMTNITGSTAALQNTDGLDNRDWRDTNDDNDSELTIDEDANSNGDYTDDRTDGQGGGSTIPDYLFKGDTDADGVADINDTDSDNDGIPDTVEAGTTGVDPSQDADADGIPNYRDSDVAGYIDTNGDGVDDRGDKDLDGIPDFQDLDSDNDGIPDAVEANNGTLPTDMTANGQYPVFYITTPANDPDGDGYAINLDPDDGGTPLANLDHDSDGLNDYLDLDSDNDGLPDLIEAGGTDADGDGRIDGFVDANNDGLASVVDLNEGGTALTYPNSDSDALNDYLDADSDNDGIGDTSEQGGRDTDSNGQIDDFADTDNDGLADEVDTDNGGTSLTFADPDGDGLENYRDLDSDNDGLQDILEAGGVDSDNNGTVDGAFVDSNENGFEDSVESTPLATRDSDGDGLDNFIDLDSDNDGITDALEFGQTIDAGTGQINGFTDSNSNGWNDAQESLVITPIDTDATSDPFDIPNYLDLDSDDDGIVDNFESQTKASYIAPSGNDTDNDGLDDAYDPDNGGTIISPTNTDGDANEDYIDNDSDEDNVGDQLEGNNAGRRQFADWDDDNDGLFDDTGFDTDVDEDGVLDIFDSFIGFGLNQVVGSNAAVQDTDVDNVWDFQDTDDDGDGEVTYDNTAGDEDNDNDDDPTNDFADGGNPNPDYLFNDPDSDGDGVANSRDADADNDGLANVNEDGGTGVDPGGDIDGDGILNYQDVDMDGDGLDNSIDSDADGDSSLDTFTLTDSNGDGVFDEFDNDLDGIPDMIDKDSDNDGIADVIELGLTDLDENGQIDGPTDGAITDVDGNGMEDSIEPDPIVSIATSPPDAQTGDAPAHLMVFDVSTTNVNADVTLSFGLTGDYGAGTAADEDFTLTLTGEGTTAIGGTFDETNSNAGAYDDCETTPMEFDITIPQADWNTFNADGVINITFQAGIGVNFCDNRSEITNVTTTYSISNPGGTPISIPDTDSDGVPNYLDVDSDNDGITDNREAQATGSYVAPVLADADGDGLLDVYDEDVAPGNAIAPVDSESAPDGTPDYLDTDSDDDLLNDIIEGHDADSDGFADWDTDGDNVFTDETGFDTDFDGDGLLDIFDTDNSTGGLANVTGSNASSQDTDGDSESDFRDEDDDNDGINTLTEDNNGNTDYTDDFTQGGGTVPDYLFVPDQDGDTILDAADGDSDNDGIPNTTEYAGATYPVGGDVSSNAGNPFGDSDGDGIYNYLDASDVNFTLTDVNSDGVDDRVDQDFDGVPNFFDLDSDNDGIVDAIEANNGVVPASFDTATGRFTYVDGDGDGIVTTVDDAGEAGTPLANEDFDSDTLADYLDLDSDEDGISDNQEGQGETRIEPTGVDANGDGWDDAYDGADAIVPVNTDVAVPAFGDAEPDYRDLDSDADSAGDRIEGHDANINGFADWDSGQDDNDYTAETGFNTDSDGDGIVDLFDDFTGIGINNINGTIAALGDTDSDGTRDWRDDDDDGDGVDTRSEDFNTNGILYDDKNQGGGAGPDYLFFADKDGDGVADNVSFDGDNDGIPNSVEIGALQNPYNDGDGDGIPAFQDSSEAGFVDSNTDGVDDRYDTDLDGEPDFLDLDSDNDGIPDAVEANGGTRPSGMNSEGQYPPAYTMANDANGNGLVDDVEAGQGGTPLSNPDSDGDGLNDYIDLDSDNDGLPDIIEAGGVDADNDGRIDAFGDTDADGLANTVDVDNGGAPLNIEDLDGDGLPNYRDADTDNDGLSDLYEAAGTDATNDGVADVLTDADGDGWVDLFDSDDGGTALSAPDTDGDGNENYRDLDSDNDGIPDAVERNGGVLPANMTTDGEYESTYASSAANDSDSDGLYNDTDGTTPSIASTDGDGVADHLDLDSDSDGIPDILEVNGTDSNNDGRIDSFVDTDGDGLADAFDSDNSGTALIIANSDGDGVLPDYRDIDADNDGIPDIVEVNGTDADNDGLPANPTTDTDGDGWADSFDSNNGGTALTVVDIDGDGRFNFQDLDADNDGLSDIIEANGIDADNDGLPADTTDSDGDGWPDTFDNDNGASPYTYPDTDADGRYNFADVDSDNDGIPDAVEANGGILPPNMSADGQFSTFNDTDGDGYADDRDSDNGGSLYADPNTDGDGQVDRLDFDSDNDGVPDAVEANGGSLPANMDANGTYSTFTDTDFDGLHDDLDSDNGGTALAIPNSDNGLAGGDTNRPDYIDLDSDGDGIVDIVEAGGVDTDQDGVVDGFADADGDGLADTVDPDFPGTPLAYTDTDGDGTPNYADTDSDNDTVSDTVEAFDSNSNAITGGGASDGVAGVTPAGVDSDGDGIDDNFEGAIPQFQNTDGDADADWVDNDDDGDGISTADENADVNPVNGIPDYLEPTTNPCGGGSVQVYPATGDLSTGAGTITNINNAAGAPDAAVAELYENGDALDIDLQHFFTAGTGSYTITWKRRTGDGDEAFLIIQEATNPAGPFTQRTIIPSTTDDTNFTITVVTPEVDTRYVRLIKDSGISGNITDLDVDAIGICSIDADNDLVADRIDEDDDNDGIPDVVEIAGLGTDPSADDDFDGVLNYLDPDVAGYVDTNADNVNDNFDQDLDGIPNHLDLDSDNDGIPDAVEANGGSLPTNMTANGKYLSSYIALNDTDGDGFANDVDADDGGTALANPNSDGDAVADFLDLDSDNDGIPDLVEAGGTDADNNGVVDSTTDSNGDGLINIVDSNEGGTALTILNSDGDSLVNYRDGDSDNDGIPDLVEAGGTDADGDGVADLATDTDGDGWVDTFDSDNGGTAIVPGDADGDGFDNYVDLDSDNDGLPDALEANGGTLPANMDADGQYPSAYVDANDTDGDGLANDVDTDNMGTALAVPNTDGRGGADYIDVDSDDDGIPDLVEAGGTDANTDATVDNTTDTDGDGIVDAFDPDNGGTPLAITNPDGDGLPTYLDLDSDNDGIPDVVEMGGVDADGDGRADNATDNDGDGWSNTYDPTNAGTPFSELDTDGDGLNNNEDLDADSDGIADAYEANGGDLPAGMNADGQYSSLTDTDGDGLHDNVDTDNGGTALPVANSDGTGNADFADADSDGDGTQDYIEAFDDDESGNAANDFRARGVAWETANGNPGQYPTTDTDGDGVPDWLEDTDADGTPNYLDPDNATYYLDSDGDGIVDLHDPDQNGVAYGGVSGQPDEDNDGIPNQYDSDDDVALPVLLVSFEGKFEDGRVILNWLTATEINNDYFDIERSTNGETFQAIGRVEGNGTTDVEREYHFTDNIPVAGINFYRLRQVDFDGTATYSWVSSVTATVDQISLSVYPNPTRNVITLSSNAIISGNARVVDMNGRVVWRVKLSSTSQEKIDLSGLSKGVYQLLIETVDGTIIKRIVKK